MKKSGGNVVGESKLETSPEKEADPGVDKKEEDKEIEAFTDDFFADGAVRK